MNNITKILIEQLLINENDILYHATNSTWDKPKTSGLGFHAGTLEAAQDRMKSFRYNINPHIKKVKLDIKNPLYLERDYRFHNNLEKVVKELYKDHVITKKDKEFLIGNIYSSDSTFDNLKTILHDKYGYDGIRYRNNIEDRGSYSYIAFYPEQIKIIGEV